jgi:hypothetical protein
MSNAESSESSTKPGSSEPSQNADLGEGASSSSLLHKLVIARGRGRAACLIAVAVIVAATVFFLGARHRKGLIRIVASPSHFPWIVVGGCALLIFLIWLVPKCQVRRLRGLAAEDRFDRENEARKTLAQIIGGLLVIGGILLSINTLLLQQETETLQEQGQITDRFSKAIEQLGAVKSDKALDRNGTAGINLEVRLGGIYALERIAQDSPRDHWTIMEVLTAYVRTNSPASDQSGQVQSTHKPSGTAEHLRGMPVEQASVRTDIQAVLTVIGRREVAHDPFARRLDLSHSDLSWAALDGTRLDKANLRGADMRGVSLGGAHLDHADLRETILYGAHLNGAQLHGADLRGVRFLNTDLRVAHLQDANLSGVDLKNTRLYGTELNGAHLEGADLSEVADLTQSQLIGTFGDVNTKLPLSIQRPVW